MSKNFDNEDVCYYSSISYIITGIVYFYYLNTLKDCNCVNEEYIKDIKYYYSIAVLGFLMNCMEINNKTLKILIKLIIISANIMFVYKVRLLINQIYRDNCECGDTYITGIINIINYLSIFMYIQVGFIILF